MESANSLRSNLSALACKAKQHLPKTKSPAVTPGFFDANDKFESAVAQAADQA